MPADVEPSPEQRIVEAAELLPGHGAITGWAGLHWQGARRWFPGSDAAGQARSIWLAIGGEDVRSQARVNVSAERLDPRDVIVVDGIRITRSVRSACFDMRYAHDEREAARILSMAAFTDHVSIEEMAGYAYQHNGWTGVPQCREGTALAEENCWSPPELDMVLTWRLDAGLPRPLCNWPVFDPAGRHIGTPDLLDVEGGVVGQYDGGLHLSGRQRAVDIQRDERYRAAGLECFVMTAADRKAPLLAAQRMLAARSRARFEAESRRLWTAELPSSWVPTHTVALRRALPDELKALLLRYRAA